MFFEHHLDTLLSREHWLPCWEASTATLFGALTFRPPNVLTQFDILGVPKALGRYFRSLEHQPFVVPTWNAQTPKHREKDRFVRGRNKLEGLVETRREASAFWQAIYAPLDEHLGPADHIRALLYDGDLFLGHIALARPTPYSAAEIASLNRDLIPQLKHALIARRALTTGLAGAEAVCLLRPDGSIEHASATAAAWLDSERRSWLRRLILDAEHHRAFAPISGPLEMRHSVVHGISGHRHLLSLAPWPALREAPKNRLTPRQRDVAERAALGATLNEIAEDLGLSSHTARQHLKAAYKTLDVHNRVELARRLASEEGISDR